MKKLGASGAMILLNELETETGREMRNIRLEPGPDGKTVHLIDIDTRKAGVHREVRYEITPAELIAVIRAQGDELPADTHILRSVSAA